MNTRKLKFSVKSTNSRLQIVKATNSKEIGAIK